jgi:hypothetical protein
LQQVRGQRRADASTRSKIVLLRFGQSVRTVSKLLTLELDFQVNVCLFTWSSALYMVAVDFPSGGQGCNNIITNNSKRLKRIRLIKLITVCWAYNINGYVSI